ncbi:MAG: putative Rossmann fold flavoprotein [Parvicellaceae bacterium]|jgi:predicted Rossmann fold flavoprotein
MKVAIIGGGAGGFFSAIAVKKNHPNAEVVIYEKSNKTLAKVKVSGGGRCNVTSGVTSIKDLSAAYPRGNKFLKKIFPEFNTRHTIEWFESRGVPLVTQSDLCVFPESQDSQTIIDCFNKEINRLGIKVQIKSAVEKIRKSGNQIVLEIRGAETETIVDKVIVATGGSPKEAGLDWLKLLNHKISPPVPSLFTFNMPNESVTELMGIVVEKTITTIPGTKLKSDGPLLITHWGMSGPSILKLSAFGARHFAENNYKFNIQVNWVNLVNYSEVNNSILNISIDHGNKQLANYRPFGLPDRLWNYLIERIGISPQKKWSELGNKGINKIVNVLTNDLYAVEGKTTFKEEFVTCGGVSLESINNRTMESKTFENLYFTGEIMDIDGITGGFNFQAAWTTAFIAGKLE